MLELGGPGILIPSERLMEERKRRSGPLRTQAAWCIYAPHIMVLSKLAFDKIVSLLWTNQTGKGETENHLRSHHLSF